VCVFEIITKKRIKEKEFCVYRFILFIIMFQSVPWDVFQMSLFSHL